MNQTYQWLGGSENLDEAFAIRIKVFCEEQGYTPDMELDEQDRHSWHLLIREGITPVATGRIYWQSEGTIRLGRIAVIDEMRGKGIGRLAVEFMIQKARSLGAETAELDAQSYAVGFYEKLGFTVSGEEHMDGHIPHKLMRKSL